jgi:hypothetical protein
LILGADSTSLRVLQASNAFHCCREQGPESGEPADHQRAESREPADHHQTHPLTLSVTHKLYALSNPIKPLLPKIAERCCKREQRENQRPARVARKRGEAGEAGETGETQVARESSGYGGGDIRSEGSIARRNPPSLLVELIFYALVPSRPHVHSLVSRFCNACHVFIVTRSQISTYLALYDRSTLS